MPHYPTLPDRIDVERLPDDVPVLKTTTGHGTCNNIHLFGDCKHVNEARNARRVPLADASRDNICSRCSGDANEGAPTDPHGTKRLLYHELEPRHVDGLTPMPPERQTPGLDQAPDAGNGVVAGD